MKTSPAAGNQSGTVVVVVVLVLVFLFGVAAFAIDIGHLMIVRNELKNAADAGALAGARVLYTSVTGTQFVINHAANGIASAAAAANTSDRSAIEVLSVEKGHWCFTCNGNKGMFTANDSLGSYSLASGMSFTALDADTNYINAVRLVAGRGPARPAASFLARVLGFSGFTSSDEAVAWVGFAGSDIDVDQPIAVCRESILDKDGSFSCTHGRMTSSSSQPNYAVETAGWTNLEQPAACDGAGAAPASDLMSLVSAGCSGGLTGYRLKAGPLTTTGGEVQSAFTPLQGCWMSNSLLDGNRDGKPDRPWKITVPMIECDGKNPGPCNNLVGAVTIEVLWITRQNDPHFNNIPPSFTDPGTGKTYTCPQTALNNKNDQTGRERCWFDFLTTFDILDQHGKPFATVADAAASYIANNMYYKPSCELTFLGDSGGLPSNVVAKIPKLVR